MNDQQFMEIMVNAQQVQAGVAVAVALGVTHYDTDAMHLFGQVDEILRHLRAQRQIAICDPAKVLNTGPGVQIGMTSTRWIQRGDYAQAVQLLGAQTVDVMRQVLAKQ